MPRLLLGPLLRYVSDTEATVWVETDGRCEVTVLGVGAATFEVGGHHYALVRLQELPAGSTLPYDVRLDGETCWPLPDDPYPLADIDLWPDDDLAIIDADDATRTIESLHQRVRELNEEVRALGEMAPPPDTEIADDPHLALYHLGSLAPLGPADRQRMLEAPTLHARLAVFATALEDAVAVVRFRSA